MKSTKILLILFLSFFAAMSFGQNKISKNKQAIIQSVEKNHYDKKRTDAESVLFLFKILSKCSDKMDLGQVLKPYKSCILKCSNLGFYRGDFFIGNPT